MSEEKLRDEYVMNESGLIYAGTYDDMFTWPWNFAQVITVLLHLGRRYYNGYTSLYALSCLDMSSFYLAPYAHVFMYNTQKYTNKFRLEFV